MSSLTNYGQMEVDDIFGYDKLVAAEKATLQKGMNYRVGKDYSVFLMSLVKHVPTGDYSQRWLGALTIVRDENRLQHLLFSEHSAC